MAKGMSRMFLLAAVCVSAVSCSVTRHTPTGQYVLMRNRIEVDRNVPRSERIMEEDVENFIQQAPARRWLGTNLGMSLYNAFPPEKNTGLARFMRRMGSAPVILDTASVTLSSSYMTRYVHSRGYFEGDASYRIDTARKRAHVTYSLHQGIPYRIGKITYDFKDKLLEPLILGDSASSLLRSGAPFDTGVLDAERTRIRDFLQNRGYFNFSVNNIRYLADSTVGDRRIDLTVEVRQFLYDYNDEGMAQFRNNALYRLQYINVYPDHDPTRIISDTTYRKDLNTLEYRGLNIIYDDMLRVRKEVLRQVISLYQNELFSAEGVSRTYSNIMRLGYYRSARIVFNESPDSTSNMITFLGGDEPAEAQTQERYLICNIYCTPSLRQGYNLGLEATFTSDYYGISSTIGYRNRSLLRGVEMLDISLTGSYDFMRTKGSKASFELGGKTSLTFPRFILPFRIHALERVENPRSKIELAVSAQRRTYYSRVVSNAKWGYSWSGNRFTIFAINPIDVGLVKMNYVDSVNFLDRLQNQYLINSYRSQLIAGISGSFLYNNTSRNARGNSLNFRLNWETSGNLLNGLCTMFGVAKSNGEYYRIFGIQFAQYARADVAVTNNIPINGKYNLVYRFYAGGGVAYGNSYSTSIPFDRLFYAGGSNSMRGWAARTLGPGNVERPEEIIYPSQLGDMRLEVNLEGRFPIWSIMRGAVFFDTGNVWYVGKGEYSREAVFRFNDFYRQLGLNTGIGLRIDIVMTVLRLDWGIRLHDPNLPAGERWIHNFRLGNTALSFAVGYPF